MGGNSIFGKWGILEWCFVGFAIAGALSMWLITRTVWPAERKRRTLRRLIIAQGPVFLALSLLTLSKSSHLDIYSVIAACFAITAITWLNAASVVICDTCGKFSVNNPPWKPKAACPK